MLGRAPKDGVISTTTCLVTGCSLWVLKGVHWCRVIQRVPSPHTGRQEPVVAETFLRSESYRAIKMLSLSKASAMPRRISPSASGQDATRSSGTFRFSWISEEPVARSCTLSEPR